MKTRPRRKVRASGAEAEDDDPMDSPGNSSSKENDSPRRLSLDVQQERFLVLLADFDNNVTMATKEIHNRYQQVVDSLTLPFLTALISSEKLPNRVRNLKWGDYLKLRSGAPVATVPAPLVSKALTSTSKLNTPAVRTSSRLAVSKKLLPPVTPKFDPSTPFASRMPKIGETLMSINGSPVGLPPTTPLSVRGVAGSDEKELLVALLSNKETLANALKDRRTRPGLLAALKNAGKLIPE